MERARREKGSKIITVLNHCRRKYVTREITETLLGS
jgi:hypothetical protein